MRLATEARSPRDRRPKQRPLQPGEVIVGCGHTQLDPFSTAIDVTNPPIFLEVVTDTEEPAISVRDPKGGELRSRWLSVCALCLSRAGLDARRVQIRDHKIYSSLAR